MSGTTKLIDEKAIRGERAGRITDDTLEDERGTCSGFITSGDGVTTRPLSENR